MPSTFSDFTLGTTAGGATPIQTDDFVVGYDTSVLNGERRWPITTLAQSVSSVMRNEIINQTSSNLYLANDVNLTGLSALSYSGSLPTNVKRITILYNNVSGAVLNLESFVRIGTGGYDTTGYIGGYGYTTSNGVADSFNTSTASGFYFTGDNAVSSTTNGYLILNKGFNNTWYSFGNYFRSGGTPAGISVMQTSFKSTANIIDSIQIITDGSGSFDSGTVSISYET